jgi:hypothetical protein
VTAEVNALVVPLTHLIQGTAATTEEFAVERLATPTGGVMGQVCLCLWYANSRRNDQPIGTKSRGLVLLICAGEIGSPGSPAGSDGVPGVCAVGVGAGIRAPVSCPT